MTEQLTPAAERALYARDIVAWRGYAAPRIAARLASGRAADLGLAWSLLTRDTQRVVWPLLDPATQERVRAAREELSE